MFTNLDNYGGTFRKVLNKEFKNASSVSIATGYASLDIIHAYSNDFIKIAENGGLARLLLGMAFYEGLSEKKLDSLTELNKKLNFYQNGSGVFVTYSRRYHGKLYYFKSNTIENIYVGSSNFSTSGTSGNIECTLSIDNKFQKTEIISFLEDLYSFENSVTIDKANIIIPGSKKYEQKISLNNLESLNRYNPKTINTSLLPKIEFSLLRIAEKEKSNLNVYFGRGRWNRQTGKVLPRPWYEIELIANKELASNQYYPKGDFLAYTDDGYIIPMRTQGDYYKNIRSKKSLQIFGMWLKGKLQKSRALKKFTPVTLDTLEEYGNDKINFYKIEEGKYFIEF